MSKQSSKTERLASMTREEKETLLLALQEKRRRELLRKPKYLPNDGQRPVHLSVARERYVFSGNGSGKSTLMANEVMWALRGYNPITGERTRLPARVIIVLDTSRKNDERFIPELRKWFDVKDEWLKRMGKPYTARIQLENGSIADFYSADADPASFEGIEATHVFIDEPIRRPLWIALKRSLRIKGFPCKLLFCGTAVSEAWLRREIYEPWAKGDLEGIDCFKVGSHVNAANLAENYLADFSRSLSEAERVVRLEGGFFDTDSLALAHLWDRHTHIIPDLAFRYDSRMPCVVAIDNHSVKPHVAIMICATETGTVAIKELRLRGTASQFAAALKPWMLGYRVIDIVCDSLGSMEGTAFEGFSSFITGLNDAGIRARATRFEEKSHEDLIDRLRNGLVIPAEADQNGQRIPTLRVLASMKGLISDIESAGWQKNRATGEMTPKLDTSTLDFLAPFGYALATDLFYQKPHKTRPVYRSESFYGVSGDSKERTVQRRKIGRLKIGRRSA
jgi:hypothetical protein